MQQHTVQQIDRGPRAGKWIYTFGNRRMGRHAECCAEAWLEMLETPAEQRDQSPAWERIGHDTSEQAYAHMRERLLENLSLDAVFGEWGGCAAPGDGEGKCDTPTKSGASIPPCHFLEHLCDRHRTREVVEAMWKGPGDWVGSW
jgi:hypothetical protein